MLNPLQVTNVRKSLMSVGKVCAEGNQVVLRANDGYIKHTASGQRTFHAEPIKQFVDLFGEYFGNC